LPPPPSNEFSEWLFVVVVVVVGEVEMMDRLKSASSEASVKQIHHSEMSADSESGLDSELASFTMTTALPKVQHTARPRATERPVPLRRLYRCWEDVTNAANAGGATRLATKMPKLEETPTYCGTQIEPTAATVANMA
jgi:hypothetical protein